MYTELKGIELVKNTLRILLDDFLPLSDFVYTKQIKKLSCTTYSYMFIT